MCEKSLFKDADLIDENGNNFLLKYYVVSMTKQSDMPNKNAGYFAIEIEKHPTDFYNTKVEFENSSWITENKDEALNILDILVRNKVTPKTLVYVIDDMLGVS